MIDKLVINISSNEDIENLNILENSKVNHLHVTISQKEILNYNFSVLFNKLSKLEPYNRFHLDMNNFSIDDEKIEIIIEAVKNWQLREINFNISNTNLSDSQFDKLLFSSLSSIKTLEKVHLILENVQLNANKIKTINSILSSLPNLKHVFLNIKNNKVNLEDLTDLNKAIQKFYSREIHF